MPKKEDFVKSDMSILESPKPASSIAFITLVEYLFCCCCFNSAMFFTIAFSSSDWEKNPESTPLTPVPGTLTSDTIPGYTGTICRFPFGAGRGCLPNGPSAYGKSAPPLVKNSGDSVVGSLSPSSKNFLLSSSLFGKNWFKTSNSSFILIFQP